MQCVRFIRPYRQAGIVTLVALMLGGVVAGPLGCASIHRERTAFGEAWDHAVEVRFPGADAAPAEGVKTRGNPDYNVDVVAAPDNPMPPMRRALRAAAAVSLWGLDQLGLSLHSRRLIPVPDRGDTKYTLIPGTYAFEYAEERVDPVWGEVHVYPISTPRARDFIRHASVNLTPSPMGMRSVLSQSDLDRVRNGDVVTKVVFIADLPAIRDRLDKIDRGLREMERVRTSLREQESYWARKVADRRLNTRYGSEFGWGVDIPSADLAFLQTVVGPERYHWHRFSEAEDQLRTHEELLSQMELPERRLTEEREALRRLLGSVTVIHRTNNLMVLSDSMIRPFHDPVHEVEQLRGGEVWSDAYRNRIPWELDDFVGPWGKVHFPYWYSSLVNGFLHPGFRPVAAPSSTLTKNVGQVLMVVQVGRRRPPELGGHSWVGTQ